MSEPTTDAGKWLDAVMGGDIPDIIVKCEAEARDAYIQSQEFEERLTRALASYHGCRRKKCDQHLEMGRSLTHYFRKKDA